jgi:hypothetical protein
VLSGPVEQSTDGGRTFSDFWNSNLSDELGFPKRLVGGGGNMPARWYLAVDADGRVGGSTLLRSDDDGGTWTDVLEYRGGGTLTTDPSAADTWNVQIQGLAYDPVQPDTVYVARTAYPALGPFTSITSGVAVSTDGGQTWSDLGSQKLGGIADLALSRDRSTLYLTSDQGLFSLAVGG